VLRSAVARSRWKDRECALTAPADWSGLAGRVWVLRCSAASNRELESWDGDCVTACCHPTANLSGHAKGPWSSERFPFLVLFLFFSMIQANHPPLDMHCQTGDCWQPGHSSDMDLQDDLKHSIEPSERKLVVGAAGRLVGLAGKGTDRGTDWPRLSNCVIASMSWLPAFPQAANLNGQIREKRQGRAVGQW